MSALARYVLGLALAASALALWSPAASPRVTLGTFPPGWWCGKGLAPAGLKIQLPNLKLTVKSGVLRFLLHAEKGDVTGDWNAIMATGGMTTPFGTANGRYKLDGGDELAGTAVRPRTVGTWHIIGKTLVKAGTAKPREVPFEQTTKKWSEELEIDFSSHDKAVGHWLHPGWKWTAHRIRTKQGTYTCA
jgi:hypothetical protein